MNQSKPERQTVAVSVPVPLHRTFDYNLPIKASHLATMGSRVIVPFGNRRLVGWITACEPSSDITTGELKEVIEVFEEPPCFNSRMLSLLLWSATYYAAPIGEVLSNATPTLLRKPNPLPIYHTKIWHATGKAYEGRSNAHRQIAALKTIQDSSHGIHQSALTVMGFDSTLIKKLEAGGYITHTSLEQSSRAMQTREERTSYHNLTAEQSRAVADISAYLGEFKPFLLEGVTGSGKTEVYIACVQKALAQDLQALILVPEINLTPQTFKRFQSQLGIPVAIMHSGMSDKEKLITHQAAANGTAQVLIGTRSAIFTPFPKLGLIIIDEEHDASYKQSEGFRYSARDLGMKRAQIENCPIVLGSATPSGDSYANALNGRYQHLRLAQRAGNATLPSIATVDMRAIQRQNTFSHESLSAIKKALDSDHQVIIFQNRRGLAPSLMCFDCGWLCPCPNCDTRITVHQHPPRLHCHHCDYQSALPSACQQCGGSNIHGVGSGTEKLEQALAYYFPKACIARLDRDEIKTQSDLEQALAKIRAGDVNLIIGTQMIAKGHDFPNVTLVIVVDADGLFFSSDFRALERGAQQLLQVAGRAGRSSKPGHVLIQTRQPDHPLFALLKEHKYAEFIENELRERSLCALPPFSRQLCVRVESPSLSDNIATLEHLKHTILSEPAASGAYSAGPLPAALSRKQNQFRHLLHFFCSESRQRLFIQQRAIELSQQNTKRSVKIKIDVDPIDVN